MSGRKVWIALSLSRVLFIDSYPGLDAENSIRYILNKREQVNESQSGLLFESVFFSEPFLQNDYGLLFFSIASFVVM